MAIRIMEVCGCGVVRLEVVEEDEYGAVGD